MIARSLSNELKDAFNDGASQTSPSSIVWSVEVSAEGVNRVTVLEKTWRLSLAEGEREKPRRCIEAETVAWSSKQFGEVSCFLDNEGLVEACEALLLQSIEEEQLRLSQVLRSDAGYELSQVASRVTSVMHAESSNGDDPFAKVKSLISEMIARLEEEASADASHKAHCDRDAGCC